MTAGTRGITIMIRRFITKHQLVSMIQTDSFQLIQNNSKHHFLLVITVQ